MKEKLCRRLERLEEIKAAADRAKAATAAPSRNICETIRELVKARGFVETGNESLAETIARAFGMTSCELRSYLRKRAAGGNTV